MTPKRQADQLIRGNRVPTDGSELLRLSAVELAGAIRSRRASAVDLIEASLERIRTKDSELKAFVTVCPDQARAAAEAADRAVRDGVPVGPLHGLPVAIKDNTLTAGIRTTFGSAIFEDNVPNIDDPCVARLRDAGAIIIGKTNTPEFACGAVCTNALQGPTANPYDLSRSSGGSSGGSAAAVAMGMTVLAQGTDFGGSVRTPASFCGVVGLRPTPGRVPSAPRRFAWNVMSVHGMLARTVDDAALMLQAMSGPDLRDPLSASVGRWTSAECAIDSGFEHIAYSADLGFAVIDPTVRRVLDQAIEQVRRMPIEVVAAHPDCAGADHAFATLRAAILHNTYAQLCADHRERCSPSFLWNVERGQGMSAFDYLHAEAERSRLYQAFVRFFERHDILVTASASVPPFSNAIDDVLEIDGVPMPTIIDYLKITYVVSLVGFPSLSIPCGWTPSGLPIGMQLVARPFEEGRLLAFARRLERELGFRHRWPH